MDVAEVAGRPEIRAGVARRAHLGQHALGVGHREVGPDRHLERPVAERGVGDLHRVARARCASPSARTRPTARSHPARAPSRPSRPARARAARRRAPRPGSARPRSRAGRRSPSGCRRPAGTPRTPDAAGRRTRACSPSSSPNRKRSSSFMRSSSQASAPRVPWISNRSFTCGPTITRLVSSEPTTPLGNSTSALAQSSFSTSTNSSVSTRVKCVPSPIGCAGRRGNVRRRAPAQPLDRADQVMRQVHDVRHQVPECARTRVGAHEPPRGGRVRPVRVVGEEDAAVMRDVADLAGPDERRRVLDGRREPVTEPDAADHARAADGVGHRLGVLDAAAHRLLDPDVLAGLGGGNRDLAVHRVRHRDAHDVDGGVLEHSAPVADRALEADPFGMRPARLADVRGDHQPRLTPASGKCSSIRR